MKEINSINQTLQMSDQELSELIEELVERTEYLCTGEVCGAHANLV